MTRFSARIPGSLLFVVFALAQGCGGGDDPAGPGGGGGEGGVPGEHTWHSDIGPLLIEKCGACHQEGSIAPFTISYDEAYAWRQSIKLTTAERTMPPMPVNNDGSCQTFSNARWLTDDEIAAIGAWVDDGAPEGEAAALPDFPEDLTLDDPDYEVDTGADYEANDDLEDDYRCFHVSAPWETDKFLTEYEVVPGNRAIAHHMILYLIAPEDADLVDAEDAKSPDVPGYPCFGAATPGGGAGNERPLILWAPGSGRSKLPDGTGIRIPAGATIVMQMHYNLSNGGGMDRTAIKMKLADEGDVEEGIFFPILNSAMVVESGQEYVLAEPGSGYEQGQFAFPDVAAPIPGVPEIAVTVHGTFPHMHKMGRTLRVDYESDAGDQCLVDVDRWDFNWQEGWWYDEPIEVPSVGTGREISITCGFDTRSTNMPDVRWGEGSDDEMCLNYLYVTSPLLGLLFGAGGG